MLAILAALTAFGAAFAMAASLGTLDSDDLGASSDVVAACDTVGGITTDFTTAWDATDERYEVTGVTIGGIDATCDGQSVQVTLTGADGSALSSGSGTYVLLTDAGSKAVSMSAGVSSAAVEGVHVQISG